MLCVFSWSSAYHCCCVEIVAFFLLCVLLLWSSVYHYCCVSIVCIVILE